MNEIKRNGSGYFDPTAYTALKNIQTEQKKTTSEREEKKMECFRGEIWFVTKPSKPGTEAESSKPALIVSNDTGNHFSNFVSVVYLTAHKPKKALPTHAEVFCRASATALCETIHTIPKEWLADLVRQCTPEEMAAVDKALRIALDLPEPESSTNCPDKCERVEEVKRELEEAKDNLEAADKLNESLQNDINNMSYELDVVRRNSALNVSEPDIKTATERDLYKNLYENLLERVIRKETTV